MHCPFCTSGLTSKRSATIELNYCTECEGTWFDRNEFGQFKAQADKTDILPLETDERLVCPRCESHTLAECETLGVRAHCCTLCQGVALRKNGLTKGLVREKNPPAGRSRHDFLGRTSGFRRLLMLPGVLAGMVTGFWLSDLPFVPSGESGLLAAFVLAMTGGGLGFVIGWGLDRAMPGPSSAIRALLDFASIFPS